MASPPSIKGAYWPSSAYNTFKPSAIETSYFTHIYYAFLEPNEETFVLKIDRLTEDKLNDFTSTLKPKNVKMLFSIGQRNYYPPAPDRLANIFATMAGEPWSRKNFIDSSIDVARKYGFDGIDLHWQFPQKPSDMKNLGVLLSEWRAAITTEADRSRLPPLLLSAATYFSVDFFQQEEVYRKYPVEFLSKNLDWINVMCYDYQYWSSETPVTGLPAAQYDPTIKKNTSYGLWSWFNAGFPKNKLIMGLPLYGRTWTLQDSSSHDIGAQAVGMGPGTQGVMPYSEVVNFNVQYTAHVNNETVRPYSYAGTSWIGYDDVKSITEKIRYAHKQGYRGYFFWAVNGDDNWELSKTASDEWTSEN